MPRGRFVGDTVRYDGLKRNTVYNVDFRNEGILVFVDVANTKHVPLGTYVFNDFQMFLDSWDFEGVKKTNRRVRKFTDFETTLFFSSGEVCELFGISMETLRRWVLSGKLRVSHRTAPGGPRRFRREDVVRLYEEHTSGF